MKELWIELKKSMSPKLRKDLIEAANNRCNAIISDDIDSYTLKSYSIPVASLMGGDISIIDEAKFRLLEIVPKPSCLRLIVKDRADDEKAVQAAEKGIDYIAISCSDWKIIPLENLIAKTHGNIKLLAEVSNSEEAETALQTLELGVDGIILKTSNINEVALTLNVLTSFDRESSGNIQLSLAKIIHCTSLSMGARACVDTCDIMVSGEGMLVGCSSSGLFLVQAEVQQNPYVEPRPFRVNAGPVSLYILAPGNKTRYLSELKSGDEALVINREGKSRTVIVGRMKIERRPLMLIEAEVDGDNIRTIIQNAETIHLVTKEGSKPVTELKSGDEVLVLHQRGGRHFGTLVEEETAIEK